MAAFDTSLPAIVLEPAEERKIPWWAWLFLAASVLLFLGFFLTFAIGVTKGGVDG